MYNTQIISQQQITFVSVDLKSLWNANKTIIWTDIKCM